MMRLLPQSLFSRMFLSLLGGLILGQSISVLFHLRERDRLLFRSNSMESAQRIADAIRMLNSLALADRQKFVTALNSPALLVSLGVIPSSQALQNPDDLDQADSFRMMLGDLLGGTPPIEGTASDPEWRLRQHAANVPGLARNTHLQKKT